MMKTQSATGVSGIGTYKQTIELSNKKRRLFEITRAVALSGNGVGGRNGNNFRLGSVLVRNNSVCSSSTNSYRSCRSLNRFYRYPFFHAEAGAIISLGLDACSGLDLYVARIKRDGTLALAKPCEECQRLIKIAGIRNVYYTASEGIYCKL